MFNNRILRILTQKCSLCKNSRQTLKFTASAKIHSFCEFREFVIFVQPYLSVTEHGDPISRLQQWSTRLETKVRISVVRDSVSSDCQIECSWRCWWKHWPLIFDAGWSNVKSSEINTPCKRALSVALNVSFPIRIAGQVCIDTVRLESTQITSSSSSSSACPELERSGFHEVLPVFSILRASPSLVETKIMRLEICSQGT